MIPNWLVILVSTFYAILLFGIASWAENRAKQGRSLIANPYTYSLSLALYCTAWTFYGSVGHASQKGITFLPIYLGPTLLAPFWWLILKKIIRISKAYRLTSIADFLASRYGKRLSLGGLVTIIAVLGGVPYIALQIKAISSSYLTMINFDGAQFVANESGSNTAFYALLLLIGFALIFGTRHLDPLERHEGIVAAIAFESIIKLSAFLSVGIFVTFGIYNGFGDLFSQAIQHADLKQLMTFYKPELYADWFWLTILSSVVFVLLPRQFHIAVVENVNEKHLDKAIWLLPLYLLLINIFVLPIAFAGRLFITTPVDADMYVLALPTITGHPVLALIVFIGGFSAAMSMVVVATMALSTMISNNLVIPFLLRLKWFNLDAEKPIVGLVLMIRRIAIILIMLFGYFYYLLIGSKYSLVSIGLISFAAISQFAPALLAGLYWKRANFKGALVGMIVGFVIWAMTLSIPAIVESGFISSNILTAGYWGFSWLKPYHLFGLQGLSPVPHSLFWSWLFNTFFLISISIWTRQDVTEKSQAVAFVDIFKQGEARASQLWRQEASIEDLTTVLMRFLGKKRTQIALNTFQTQQPESNLVQFAERQLASVIGASSAQVVISNFVKEQPIEMDEVLRILDETSEILRTNRKLEDKSRELEQVTTELRVANEQLKALDQLKDEFVTTITHELRTPLTSMRTFTEILRANEDLPLEKRREFLDIMLKESERLSRLINQVLDLEKNDSGKMEWHFAPTNFSLLIHDAIQSVEPLLAGKKITIQTVLSTDQAIATADRDRLLQVLVNLLSNAIKFCPNVQGKIEVQLKRKLGRIYVAVKDNGEGISPQDQLVVFDKFRQISDVKKGKPSGTGLGLAISKQIVEAHQGKIGVQSKVGTGATFYFEIPDKTKK